MTDNVSKTLEILERLIGFDTVSARSNLDLISYAEAYLQERGFTTMRLPDETGTKAGLFAEIGPVGRGILLSGHTDVVPVEGQPWTCDPFRLTRQGDRVYGRGTTDMKGYVAAMLALADRLGARDLKAPLKLLLSYDEEVGCVGIQHMRPHLASLLGQPELCIVGEPTQMQVATGHKGKIALRAECVGQSGHSSLAPRFVNALHLAADFLGELRTIQSELAGSGQHDAAYDIPYSTVHVGRMAGGMALNIVPDLAELTFEVRHLAIENPQEILSRITSAADAMAARYHDLWEGAAIRVTETNSYPGLETDPESPAARAAQLAAGNSQPIKVAYGTEAGVFHELGIPTVVCGPGSMEGQGHKPDEFVTLEQLAACNAMLDRLTADLVE